MKRISVLLAALLIMCLCVSCGNSGNKNSEIIEGLELSKNASEFFGYVEKGDFEKANEIFNEISASLDGTAELKNISRSISKSINEKYLKGEISKEEAERRREVLNDVKLYFSFMDPVTEYDEICESKDIYNEGILNFENEKYMEAIDNFNGVIEGDCNYADAQIKLSKSKEKYKEEKITNIREKIENGKLTEAIVTLREIKSVIGEDTETDDMLLECESKYLKETIERANSKFINPETDWSYALSIVESAQEYMPENEVIKEYIAKFKEYEPISLFDVQLLSQSSNYDVETVKDNLGNTYNKAMAGRWLGYYTDNEDIKYKNAIYVLDKKYNKLSFTVAVKGDLDDDCYSKIRVYGDGQVLYDSGDLNSSTKPVEMEIDVSGVTDLEIGIEYNGPKHVMYVSGVGINVIFGGPMVQKTEK